MPKNYQQLKVIVDEIIQVINKNQLTDSDTDSVLAFVKHAITFERLMKDLRSDDE